MSNVIYRGPVEREPKTINLPIKEALKPGTVVKIVDGKFEKATDAKGRRFVLQNSRYLGQTIHDAYKAGETAIAFRLEPEHEYFLQLKDGAYTHGQELTIDTDGKLAPATAEGDVVMFFFDEAKGRTVTEASSKHKAFGDVVVANFYSKKA
ncbi:hypothetical protein SAMN05660772_02788 [Pasteurella testudinis DSM 23072]|uniref:Uncharacterized protein n=1 Tax=Pasteurella testudinis DSM 23072 TaxID=1122938 RepID=A0A1W1V3Z2_9PAST|nr:hypothetical protein [Pasteurella testudinis]SMB87973.1 hypothetical protein SAMN05660772_02788 [Pasteurella testudinis DSM 23072]SUB51630.1 Uncharacterised protein [Pasteurella testudinis]